MSAGKALVRLIRTEQNEAAERCAQIKAARC